MSLPSSISSFNLRVYGLWHDSRERVLLTRERHQGEEDILKFPGGGVELGEGPLDALRREFREETGLEVLEAEHFYTTDFFQVSYFNPQHQIISLYYRVRCREDQPLEKLDAADDVLEFVWVPLAKLKGSMLRFPIDQHVAGLLLAEHELGLRFSDIWD